VIGGNERRVWYADAWRRRAAATPFPPERQSHLIKSATLQEREAELIDQSLVCIDESYLLLRETERLLAKR
jgi:hypothetical protein